MHSFLRPYGEEVKAKNEKRRTRALGGEVGAEGAEVGGGGIHDREGRPNSGEKDLSVVAASLQMSDTPKNSRRIAGTRREWGSVRQGAVRGRELSPDDWHACARCGRE